VSHSRKILSQAGTSLADVYDIEGSIVGLEDLDVNEIKGVHDLGPQIHSERLQTFLVLATSGAVAQSVGWNITTAGFPDSINRLLAVTVLSSVTARVSHCSVAIQDVESGREIPIWAWDETPDSEQLVQWSLDGAAVATFINLRSTAALSIPQLLTRTGVSNAMPALIFRGLTNAFGAGNVQVRVVYQLARPNSGNPPAGEPSSHGLPIPGW